MFMIAMMMSIINNQTRLKNASYTIINDILKKLNAKDELDDTIEKLNEAEIRQIVYDILDEKSIVCVDQIEEEQ